MILRKAPPVHLTYCLNVHPGETWEAVFGNVRDKACAVRDRIETDGPFGLGLRLGQEAATQLQGPGVLEEFAAFLKQENLYVFTLNGFPYGRFHQAGLKEKVYQPDWRTASRRDYTVQLADLLAVLLPDGQEGSISTVPGSFKPWIIRPGEEQRMVERLVECVAHLAALHDRTGKLIHLGLEPEAGCTLETTAETIAFFEERLLKTGRAFLTRRRGCSPDQAEAEIRRHLGVCFDACHAAIQFEELEPSLQAFRSAGLRVSKVQLSAALEVHNERSQLEALRPFVEPVYLHQVKARTRMGTLRSWNDLPDALRDIHPRGEVERIRIHFHVPLHWHGDHLLGTTASQLTPAFLKAACADPVTHLEIETYTFDVLPDPIRAADVVESVAQEYRWVLDRILPVLEASPSATPAARPAAPPRAVQEQA